MKYKEVDLGYDPICSFKLVNPYTLAFCRTCNNGNVLVKGGLRFVEDYIKRKLGPALVAYRLYYKGHSRGYVKLKNCSRHWVATLFRNGRKRLVLFETGSKASEEVFSWRRCPSTFPNILREHYAS